MERHPLPQHVSGYEFRLVGNMTLKQFGELALGVILAMITWSLPIMPFFKYPLVGFFGFLGVALAFLPINEQPLDKWIINFFRSIYSPTQYLWQKSEVSLDLWERIARPLAEADQEKLKEYLQPVPSASIKPWEKESVEELTIPERQPVKIETPQPEPPPPPIDRPAPELPQFKKTIRSTVKPEFEAKLPLPNRPTVPNILIGMIFDYQGKILTDAMIEIRDEKGFPVRALKANKLGQFSIATPLKNGIYEIEIEKENYQFDIIKIKATGEIIDPLKIHAKEKIT